VGVPAIIDNFTHLLYAIHSTQHQKCVMPYTHRTTVTTPST